ILKKKAARQVRSLLGFAESAFEAACHAYINSKETFVQEIRTGPKLVLGPVVFGQANAIHFGRCCSDPSLWENYRVLRPLWTEFPAQTVRVHSLQEGAHAVLVSIHESSHRIHRSSLQHCAWILLAAAANLCPSRARFISRVGLVQPEGR